MMSGSLLGPALLFCPADRPDRYEKAMQRSDSVIFDLEDAVAPDAKEGARRTLTDALSGMDLQRVVVRVNSADTPWFWDDVRALRGHGVPLMLPKAESRDVLHELSEFDVLPICETPRGALAAHELALAENTIGLLWGGEDLTASLGGRATRDASGRYLPLVTHLRSMILLAAGAAGRLPIDGAYLAIGDPEGLAAEAYEGICMGFKAKIAIHPSQVDIIRAAFTPTEEELRWARGVVAAAAGSRGVFAYEGRMIDEPLLRQARERLAAVESQ
jgi:citrate lyase subunit beta/citryl-CoA lyase